MKLQIIVATQGADELKTIDWSDSSDRKWLTNHQHWAMNNGKSVILTPCHINQGLTWDQILGKTF